VSDRTSRLDRALEAIDWINAGDPRTELVDGRSQPKELVYGHRMSRILEAFEPGASEALQVAARGQHIARWKIPREEFPEGRKGYKQWRSRLMRFHADLLAEVLEGVGYDTDFIDRVGVLVRKQGLGRDSEVQALEDVICLVFLQHYLEPFIDEHEDDKVVDILRKTWGKMSKRGHSAALELELGERGGRLVGRALSED